MLSIQYVLVFRKHNFELKWKRSFLYECHGLFMTLLNHDHSSHTPFLFAFFLPPIRFNSTC